MKRMLLCLLCCAPLPGWAAEALPPGLMVLDGRPAPGLRLADADGKQTDLKELRGHWVMVHFWASWCGPCRAEMPSLQRLVESGKVPALKLVVVNTAEGDDEVAAFLNRHAPDLATLMDRDGQVTERWQPRGLPSSFFVDPEGRLRYLALGGRPWDTLPYLQFLWQLPIPVPGP
jgi:thiol-disulfide isomerase/thioredoxin